MSDKGTEAIKLFRRWRKEGLIKTDEELEIMVNRIKSTKKTLEK